MSRAPTPRRHASLAIGVALLGLSGCAGSNGGNGSGGNGGTTTGGHAGGDAGGAGGGGQGGAGARGGAAGAAIAGTGGGQAGAGARGGAGGTAGAAGSGAAGTGGRAGGGGRAGTSGGAGAGGRGGSAGSAGSAGSTGSAGSAGAGGTSACGAAAPNPNPLGCAFGWGRNDPGSGALDGLQFVTSWVEPTVRADGTFPSCSGCTWLTSRVAPTNLVPVFYAYFIGFYGHANGLPDGNLGPPPNLTTDASALIKANRARVIEMYASYARAVHAVWSTRPLVWLLEGDFMQYADSGQTSPFTLAELGRLAADITCAIKGNMPNAVVAMNHTTWNGNDETDAFWNAMRVASLDLVWTTGVANNGPYIEAAANPTYYNATTATYQYIHELTGKNILVDTSCGASAMADTWTRATPAVLNGHIGNGVIGLTICDTPPPDFASRIATLAPQLASTCR